jgi:hypothetical protein
MPLALRIPLIPAGTELTAVLVVVCFSAGLNVYATVAMLGLLSRAKRLMLPGSLHGIENWYVIRSVLFAFPGGNSGGQDPNLRFALERGAHFRADSCCGVARVWCYFGAAGRQAATRNAVWRSDRFAGTRRQRGGTRAVTPSPEPVSNMALSLGEDATVIF